MFFLPEEKNLQDGSVLNDQKKKLDMALGHSDMAVQKMS